MYCKASGYAGIDLLISKIVRHLTALCAIALHSRPTFCVPEYAGGMLFVSFIHLFLPLPLLLLNPQTKGHIEHASSSRALARHHWQCPLPHGDTAELFERPEGGTVFQCEVWALQMVATWLLKRETRHCHIGFYVNSEAALWSVGNAQWQNHFCQLTKKRKNVKYVSCSETCTRFGKRRQLFA